MRPSMIDSVAIDQFLYHRSRAVNSSARTAKPIRRADPAARRIPGATTAAWPMSGFAPLRTTALLLGFVAKWACVRIQLLEPFYGWSGFVGEGAIVVLGVQVSLVRSRKRQAAVPSI